MNSRIIQGDNVTVLSQFPDNHFDSIVTDPPYGIDFLGKEWDATTGALETYQECLRVLKPGGHILAFSAARTYHHLAVTVEQAGFEIRDQIMWIYSSGFPKSQDVGKSIERTEGKRKKLPSDNGTAIVGMGTQCPACGKKENGSNQYKCKQEPCPLQEVLRPADNEWSGWGTQLKPAHEPIVMARKPIQLSIARNCQKYGVGALHIDATRIEGLTEKELNWTPQRQQAGDNTEIGTFGASGLIGQEISMFNDKGRFPSNVVGEIEGYQKYFYCPKVGRAERHIQGQAENNHPTVKPIELMKYLIQLVTPAGGRVLDPFNGSGSTGCAAVELDYDYTGIELDPAYVAISEQRIAAWYQHTHPLQATGLFA